MLYWYCAIFVLAIMRYSSSRCGQSHKERCDHYYPAFLQMLHEAILIELTTIPTSDIELVVLRSLV